MRARGARVLDTGTDRQPPSGEELVLFLHVDFALLEKDINGYLAFVMDIVSAHNFVQAVHDYVAGKLG